jgi:hypothetical protein
MVALITAIIVFLLTLYAARQSQASLIAYANGMGWAQTTANMLQAMVDADTAKHGTLPTALANVPQIASSIASQPSFLHDPWGRPFYLVMVGPKAVVVSDGKDGAPGGEGLHADIVAGGSLRGWVPTWGQYLNLPSTRAVFILCALTATVAGLIAFGGRSRPVSVRRWWTIILLRSAITAAASIAIGGVMAVLCAPQAGGH